MGSGRQALGPLPWPPRVVLSAPCVRGFGLAVCGRRGIVVVSGLDDATLHVYSLTTGAPLRTIGGPGTGRGHCAWDLGGLCMTPRGTVLVAEGGNSRLQEVNVDDGSHVRFVGERLLNRPQFVDANGSVIVVTDREHYVTVLAWSTGEQLRTFGREGCRDDAFRRPYGLRLLRDGRYGERGRTRVCHDAYAFLLAGRCC